jgi:hypothetical protein
MRRCHYEFVAPIGASQEVDVPTGSDEQIVARCKAKIIHRRVEPPRSQGRNGFRTVQHDLSSLATQGEHGAV